MIKIALLITILAVSTISYAESKQDVMIKAGFLTGNDFRGFGEAEKSLYAMGFIDGILAAPLFNAPKKELQWIERCGVGMKSGQVVAIFEKFLNENPARWHEQMNILAFSALRESCKN